MRKTEWSRQRSGGDQKETTVGKPSAEESRTGEQLTSVSAWAEMGVIATRNLLGTTKPCWLAQSFTENGADVDFLQEPDGEQQCLARVPMETRPSEHEIQHRPLDG